MSESTFKPVLFLKQHCPFCLKLRIFLLEANLLDFVSLREFLPDSDHEQTIRAELEGKIEKITFPTAELTPGEYRSDSDGIITRLAEKVGIDTAMLPTYRSYVDGAFKRMQALYIENINLKKQLD